MTMKKSTVLISACVLPYLTSQAHADPLDEAYKRGYMQGYSDASSPSLPGTNTIPVDGSKFKAYIAPKSGTILSIGNDSAVAIVPQNSISAFKNKLGQEFIVNNKILMNDSASQ